MMRFASLLFIPALALAAAAQAADPEAIAAAETALAAARAEKDAAQAALEALVGELQDDYAALTVGDEAPARRHALVMALRDALPAASARLAAEAAKGRAVLRGTRRQILLDACVAPLEAAATVDPRLAAFVGRRVADALSQRESFDGLSDEDILAVIDRELPAGRDFFQFWNDSFRIGLPEAERWQAALTAYEAAGVRLDRLRNPERYGAKGEVAPAGMVIVPGGNYELGPSSGWERPARRVRLAAFAIDRHEVTEREYALFVNAQPRERRAALLPRGWKPTPEGEALVPEERRALPVVFVNWSQAAAYAAWAGKRLPTEDEWEAACRGRDGRLYPWGDAYLPGRCNDSTVGLAATVPVGTYPLGASPFQAYDLAGNVEEWTRSTEDGDTLTLLTSNIAPIVVRGGHFLSTKENVSGAFRWVAPGGSTREPYLGFRCVADLP
jgi:formylglycine-generating enzyme required for sulfatase activity